MAEINLEYGIYGSLEGTGIDYFLDSEDHDKSLRWNTSCLLYERLIAECEDFLGAETIRQPFTFQCQPLDESDSQEMQIPHRSKVDGTDSFDKVFEHLFSLNSSFLVHLFNDERLIEIEIDGKEIESICLTSGGEVDVEVFLKFFNNTYEFHSFSSNEKINNWIIDHLSMQKGMCYELAEF